MKLHAHLIAASLFCGVATLIFSTGCEDSAARKQQEVQAQLSKIGGELKLALAGSGSADGDAAAQVEQKLNGLVKRLGEIKDGEAGQQAATSLMAATALREMAGLQMSAAESILNEQRHARAVIGSQVDGLLKLQALASGIGAAKSTQGEQQLRRDLEATQKRAAELSAALAKLQSEIAERDEPNTVSAEQVSKLRAQVAELRRKAQEMGSADGFETFRRASDTSRQADKIENEMGHRQAELEYALRPEQKLTDSQASQVQAMIKSIQTAQAQLASIETALNGDVAATKAKIDEYTAQITAALAKLNEQSEGSLKSDFESAATSLDKAATQAKAAASKSQGEGLQAARLVIARVHEAQGRLFAMQAQGLSDQLVLLAQLANVDGMSEGGQLKVIAAARDQAVEQAKAAYTSAQEIAAQVQLRSDPAASEAFTKNIDAAILSLSGKPAASAATISTGSTATPASAAPEMALGMPTASAVGFATAEEALAFLVAMGSSPEPLDVQEGKLLESSHAATPQGKAALQMSSSTMADMKVLSAALIEKYGAEKSVAALKAAHMAAAPDLADAKVTPIDETHASYAVTEAGMKVTKYLIKVDGRWYFDADQMTPQEQQMVAMGPAIVQAAKSAMQETAQAVRDGKYATAEEAVQGVQQTLMAKLAGSMAGTTGNGAAKK